MSDPTQNDSAGQEPRAIYCMHCGTSATEDDYACNRCGERVYIPDPARVPPLGFTSCMHCATVNEAHASYCANCAAEIDQNARISPDGADTSRDDNPFGSTSDADQHADRRGGGYRIGSGNFNPSQWGLPRRTRTSSSQEEDNPTPQEIQRWNWSAFILGPIWGVVHGLWWTILGFLPLLPLPPTLRSVGFIILFGVMVILGLKGNEMAWRSGSGKAPRNSSPFNSVGRHGASSSPSAL